MGKVISSYAVICEHDRGWPITLPAHPIDHPFPFLPCFFVHRRRNHGCCVCLETAEEGGGGNQHRYARRIENYNLYPCGIA